MERRLYRSRSDRMISGVCGGLAEYLSLDPTLVRVGVVLLAIVSQGGIVIAYLVMSIVVPEEPLEDPADALSTPPSSASDDRGGIVMNENDSQTNGTNVAGTTSSEAPVSTASEPQAPSTPQWAPAPAPVPEKRSHRRGGMGFGLVLILVGLLLLTNQFVPGIDLWRFWPLLIVAVGVSAVYKGVRR